LNNAIRCVTGESGTGKEVTAQLIHKLSSRRDGPYVAVNCAAIPEPLIESHLFGHEKGAFTGADRRQQGFFESANGGTILLDEITEMRCETQAKLLRAIESAGFCLLVVRKRYPSARGCWRRPIDRSGERFGTDIYATICTIA
jgi:transcriptional regulator with PAS, ATPase and Fis domain